MDASWNRLSGSSFRSDLSTVKKSKKGIQSDCGTASTDRQAVHQPARPPVTPLTGLVLNLCPALMNEAVPALRYEVVGRSDETRPSCGCSGSSGRAARAEAAGLLGGPLSDEVTVHAEEASRTDWPLTELHTCGHECFLSPRSVCLPAPHLSSDFSHFIP